MKTVTYFFVVCLFSFDYYPNNFPQIMEYPCKGNKEVDFYAKYGKVEQTSSDHILCTYSNDSINVKLLLEDCNIVYRYIKNKNGNYSMAKYSNNELFFFDSVSVAGKMIVSFHYGVDEDDEINNLPSYIRKDVKK